MTDENDTNEFEEEFDFEAEDQELFGDMDEELMGEDAPPPPEPKKSRLPLIIGGIVGVVVVWQLGSFLFSSSDEKIDATQIEKTTDSGVDLPPDESKISGEITEPNGDQTGQTGSDGAQAEAFSDLEDDIFGLKKPEPEKPAVTIENVIEKMDQQEKQTAQRIKALEKTLNEIVKSVEKLNSNVGKIGNEMTNSQNAIKELSSDVKKMKIAPKPRVKKEEMPARKEPSMEMRTEPKFTNPTLSVHAIIPGRAWLKTNDGKTITVTEGDTLQNYGKVLVIDAPNNIVITSSGVTLR